MILKPGVREDIKQRKKETEEGEYFNNFFFDGEFISEVTGQESHDDMRHGNEAKDEAHLEVRDPLVLDIEREEFNKDANKSKHIEEECLDK